MRKLLIVEDDQDDIYFFKQALAEFDNEYELTHLRNGKEFLEYGCGQHTSDVSLVLLDLNMPVLDGRAVLEKLAAMSPKPKWPIIVYTTSRRDEDIDYSYRLGALSYIVKPDTITELKQTLKKTFKLLV